MALSQVALQAQVSRLYHLGFILLLFTGSRIYLPWRWVPYIFLVAAVGFFATIMADYTDYAMVQLTLYMSVILLSFCLYFVLCQNPRLFVPAILAGIIIAFLAVAPDIVIYLYPRMNLPASEWLSEFPYYGHIRQFGYHSFLASTASLVLAITRPGQRWFWVIILFICLSITVWSGSRGAIAAWVIFVGLSGIFLFKFARGLKYIAICLTVLAISTSALLFTPSDQFIVEMVQRSSVPDVSTSSINSILQGRLSFWGGVALHSIDRPVLGFGPDGYRLLPSRIHGQIQAHSSLFQLIVEFGWVGGMIILAVFWRFFRQFYTGTRLFVGAGTPEHLRLCMLSFISAFFIYSLIDGLLYHGLPLAHFAILTAMLASLSFPARDSVEKTGPEEDT